MRTTALAVVCALALASFACGDDWPQFRGPDRSGVSQEKGLLKAWPKGGPKLAWTFKDAGIGFSTVAVAKGVVYTLGTDLVVKNNQALCTDEFLIALEEKSGNVLWRVKLGPVFTFAGNQWGDGPRSTPTVDGNFVYALGAQGELVCVDTANKQNVVWRKNLITDLGGAVMSVGNDTWGYSESPLIDGNLLICTPGGPKGTLAALDKKTGDVIWRSKDLTHHAPYSSVVVAEFHGMRQYIQMGYHNVVGKEEGFVFGIDAKEGKFHWQQSIFKGGQSYNLAATPVVKVTRSDVPGNTVNHVYVTSAYGGGCHLFQIDAKQKATEQYKKATWKKVKNNHGGLVLIGDHLFGHSETKMWVCQELKSGDVVWDERNQLECASGSITAADGMLYLYTDGGTAALVPADPKAFNLAGSLTIPMKSTIPQMRKTSRASQTWAYPVVANGRLYLRDHEYVFAFDIRAK